MSTKFKEELIKLMEKHRVTLEIDVDDDYAGVQGVRLIYNTLNEKGEEITTGNQLHKIDALNRVIRARHIKDCL